MRHSGTYDLLIVGGGINGAGIARDAAGRGLSVLLCEQDDLAAHTSSASTKLIHGGLRYLEHLEFSLVRKALIEREILLGSAPHLMRPLRFVLPHDTHLRPPWLIGAGLFLYDHLARRRRLAGSARIDLRRHVAGAALKPQYVDGFVYSDGWTDDARLVVLNAVDAHERGALILTRTRCEKLEESEGRWIATLATPTGTQRVSARAVVNATGPWVAQFAREDSPVSVCHSVRLVKGSHIVVPRIYAHRFAYLFQNDDRRIVFAIPYEREFTLIGTTDVEYTGDPAAVRIDSAEVQYLCAAVSRYFAKPVRPEDVVWSYSGVRPLLDDDAANPASVTRDYALELDRHPAPLLNVFGGKITTYRKLAESAVDMLARELGSPRSAWTAHALLPGGDLPRGAYARFLRSLERAHPWLPASLRYRYAHAYGTRVSHILRDARSTTDLGDELLPQLYEREADYLCRVEFAQTAEDILWRRTRLGLHVGTSGLGRLEEWLARRSRGRISPAARALVVMACAALWLACGRAVHANSPAPDLSGVVRCAGGSTMQPLMASWGRRFHELHPGAMVEIDPRVTLAADGFRELLAGRVDLVDFVREPFPAEIAAFKRKFGYAPLLVSVANGSFDTPGGTHAIAIYVNSSNPLRQLTLDQLDEVFSAAPLRGSGVPISTWGGLGLKGSWARRPIHVYGMAPLRSSSNPPGIVNFMEIRVLRGGDFRSDLHVERDGPSETALQAIVRAVANDPEGIGYSGFGYTVSGVKTLALAKYPGGPYVQGGPEQVADRTYPLSRQIYLGLNSPPGHPLPPLVKAFIELALSPQGQQAVAHTPDHFLPLTPAQVTRSRLQLVARAAPAGPALPDPVASPAASAPYLTADGAISIVGYNDMQEMVESLDRLFERTHPGAHFALSLKGTRTAPAALAAGRSLLAPMGAEFQPDQLAAYRRVAGSDPIAFRIAHDSLDPQARSGPLVIFVPASNPLPELTLPRLERIFTASGRGLRWGQLGLSGDLANRPIHLYGLAAATPLGRFMRLHALAGRPFDKQFIGLRESADVVREVGDDPLGIGFAAINHVTPAVRMVPLARREGERASRATRAEVIAGRYPLDRYLLIYARIPPGGRLDPVARDYLRLALSPEGQRAIASGHLGYLPLNMTEAAAERAKLAALP